MNELIKVTYDGEEPTVSARALHEALGVASRFSRWFDSNKELFVEGDDYNKCTSCTVVNNGATRELEDYRISILMAKHLAMMSRTEKGKEIRNYLIDLEKAWNTPDLVMARALKMADKKIHVLEAENEKNKAIIEEQRPKVEFANHVSDSSNYIDMGTMAKLLNENGINIGRNRLFQFLRDRKILMRNNVPYQSYIDRGYFVVKECTVVLKNNNYAVRATTYITGEGQQFIFDLVNKSDEFTSRLNTGVYRPGVGTTIME